MMKIFILMLFSCCMAFGQTKFPGDKSLAVGSGSIVYSPFEYSPVYSAQFTKVGKKKSEWGFGAYAGFEGEAEKEISNYRLYFVFDKSIARGRHGRLWLSVPFSVGGGHEDYDRSIFNAETAEFYPYAGIGVKLEYYITRGFSLVLQQGGTATFLKTVNNLQAQGQFFIKFKINSNKGL